jgi:hypothetical protein
MAEGDSLKRLRLSDRRILLLTWRVHRLSTGVYLRCLYYRYVAYWFEATVGSDPMFTAGGQVVLPILITGSAVDYHAGEGGA